MKCSDVDRILPDLIDSALIEGTNGDQDLEFQSHVKTCPRCAELVWDLKTIASEARLLSSIEEPAPRVWLRIAAELRAEGLIREPEKELAPTRPVPKRRWSFFWLAPVAAAILAVGSYLLIHKPTPPATPQLAQQSAKQQPETNVAELPVAHQPAAQQAAERQATTPASHSPALQTPRAPEFAEVAPPSNEDDQQFLSEVSTRAPNMRATYESQLRAVNNEIRETQAYINRNPGDVDARQYLLEVYQQKAMLYQMALDRIQ